MSSLSGLSAAVPCRSSWILSAEPVDVQRTLEAVINVLLPGGGAHGTAPDEPGALDSRLYDETIYAHLRGEYFGTIVDQAALDQAARALDLTARCLQLLKQSFADLSEEGQLGLLAFVTRRDDEGKAPYLSPIQKTCLRLGDAEGRAPQTIDLARFAGLIFYMSNPGLAWLKQFGYPGPNWGFNPANGWAEMDPPYLRGEDLDLFGGLIPSITPGTFPPELVRASAR
jgi:hypothetical protein